jgi:arginine exporter protein ArgO
VRALLEGVVAGFGIAIPVGPITILIFDTALRRGLWSAAPAAAGAASADLVYATIAAVVGISLADALRPHAHTFRLISAAVLLAIAAFRTWTLFHTRSVGTVEEKPARSPGRTYLTFLGLTLSNPLTITYFAALIVGLQGGALDSGLARGLFVIGAAVASLSWQLFLAGAGSLLHRRMPAGARTATGLVGNLVIALLALRLAL